MRAPGSIKGGARGWGVLWRGKEQHLMGQHCADEAAKADLLCMQPLVFRTKDAARAFILRTCGYIATRRDLRAEPHCWRMPQPVKVTVSVRPT